MLLHSTLNQPSTHTFVWSEQTLRLLFFMLPQQYFYLSCETAIQIDEVQQHDIFCTSITLQDWATWVKSQQTITFPDISSPHSDRWWILPDKAFIIAQNRVCTKISSLFFCPLSSASLSKPRWTQPQKQNDSSNGVRDGEMLNLRRIFTDNPKRISLLNSWNDGAVGRGACPSENNRSMPALIWFCFSLRGASVEMNAAEDSFLSFI